MSWADSMFRGFAGYLEGGRGLSVVVVVVVGHHIKGESKVNFLRSRTHTRLPLIRSIPQPHHCAC